MNQRREYVSAPAAAQRLSVTPPTVRRYWEDGLLEGYITRPGRYGRLRIYVDSLDRFEEQQRGGGNSQQDQEVKE